MKNLIDLTEWIGDTEKQWLAGQFRDLTKKQFSEWLTDNVWETAYQLYAGVPNKGNFRRAVRLVMFYSDRLGISITETNKRVINLMKDLRK